MWCRCKNIFNFDKWNQRTCGDYSSIVPLIPTGQKDKDGKPIMMEDWRGYKGPYAKRIKTMPVKTAEQHKRSANKNR